MTGVPASAAGGSPAGASHRAEGQGLGAAEGQGPGTAAAVTGQGRDAAAGATGPQDAAGRIVDQELDAADLAGRALGADEGLGAVDGTAASGDAGADGERDAGRPARGGKLAAAAVNQASVWNVANLLTMLRLVLVPGFVALMLADGGYDPAWRSFAWAAFAVAMITDLFDGHLARTYDLVTDFGKIADPIADKAIMGAALICLSALGDLPWWVTVVILGRELGVTLLRFWVIRYGVIPASRGGKLKTLTQGVAVGMYVLALTGWLASLRFWVMAVAVVLTVATGLDYVKQAIVLRRQGIAERRAALEETEA
ncbi:MULTISPECIES: CDP-diacylglycerol--glycerol-3-phosphate 3-phosphatidyltransferase [Streptomyces]|uniref:CDP-diacylglycerol--glycerol-3-phosphate 3-phosphatidyltransferase n=1 Tax=Streptomyces lasalocidi TaxID=324833 RepID=A0A4U5WLS4_STRLS|nr:CDP-diacylglycerol--glycerol-3-phosphate 3-phosphatidyltransferase [Streptomyces lasalocidi]TKT03125.1 CDP-diacylglycerol--glycerol-3-phosphate 3-phosphatidyltransferase [Streptomyces lasalocidi]